LPVNEDKNGLLSNKHIVAASAMGVLLILAGFLAEECLRSLPTPLWSIFRKEAAFSFQANSTLKPGFRRLHTAPQATRTRLRTFRLHTIKVFRGVRADIVYLNE
jgi:hypothetical protein